LLIVPIFRWEDWVPDQAMKHNPCWKLPEKHQAECLARLHPERPMFPESLPWGSFPRELLWLLSYHGETVGKPSAAHPHPHPAPQTKRAWNEILSPGSVECHLCDFKDSLCCTSKVTPKDSITISCPWILQLSTKWFVFFFFFSSHHPLLFWVTQGCMERFPFSLKKPFPVAFNRSPSRTPGWCSNQKTGASHVPLTGSLDLEIKLTT
jgi:hypothetical protein